MEETREGPSYDPSVKANQTAKLLQVSLNILIAATLLLYLLLGGFAIWVYISSEENTKSLCALRQNAQDRVVQSEEFLRDHPKGFAGFTSAEIRRNNETSSRTVRALDGLDCPSFISTR